MNPNISVKTKLAIFAKLDRLWSDERFNNGHSKPEPPPPVVLSLPRPGDPF